MRCYLFPGPGGTSTAKELDMFHFDGFLPLDIAPLQVAGASTLHVAIPAPVLGHGFVAATSMTVNEEIHSVDKASFHKGTTVCLFKFGFGHSPFGNCDFRW